ncbi:DUF4362 domain-containing protein [Paenibacillus chibensis]|uniref:DUF4362 domain-containing protein n=1 Tax=Paenibacillus chibensis TaxID=59846 RepID=UPI000FD7338F|nr:DUF4362 domain-containing protein [Paenibacillus chibensis]MEC0370624.1 DUF4362 domain-containing protein [Paenibacillus chibensis]
MNKWVWILTVIVLVLIGGLVYSVRMNSEMKSSYMQKGILTNFDQSDLKRMNSLYERFKNQQGDHLMLITPTIDSGPVIYNLTTNGTEIHWTVDYTRDSNSVNKKITYVCKDMMKEEDMNGTIYSVTHCGGYDEDERLGPVIFAKK